MAMGLMDFNDRYDPAGEEQRRIGLLGAMDGEEASSGRREGLGRGLLDWLANNQSALAMASAGFLSNQGGRGGGMMGWARGSEMDRARREAATREKEREDRLKAIQMWTQQAVQSGRMSPEDAAVVAANPELAQQFMGPKDRWEPTTINGIPGMRNARDGSFDPFPSAGSSATDDQREYQTYVEQALAAGQQPVSFMDYQLQLKRAGATSVDLGAGRLPANYRWIDESNPDAGVEPIPGGPGEQMPSELAARIGLAKDALQRLGKVEEAAASGEMTGPIDYAKGVMGWGAQGTMRRELTAGAEALTRMLTGAGMNMAEAQREVTMYLPAATDDAATLASKVQQLRRRLEATVQEAQRGRGGAPRPSQRGPAVPEGVDPAIWNEMTPEERAEWLN